MKLPPLHLRELFWLVLVGSLAGAPQLQAQPPADFPQEVSVKEAQVVLKTLTTRTNKCGKALWEGEVWGHYSKTYTKQAQTPWLSVPVNVGAGFVTDDKDIFLIRITINGHEYRREDRNAKALVWVRGPRP